MFGAVLLAMQVASGQQDSTYATAALRTLVERASQANASVPSTLASYRAAVETEMALIVVDTAGRERTGQIEQLGGIATWSRRAGFETHVSGYRSQSMGLSFPVPGMFRTWSIPMLYGQRLMLGIESARVADSVERQGRLIMGVHPFASDRDRYYRFAGGDTVATLMTAGRKIPVVRIRVIPNVKEPTAFVALDGEIDIDADRLEIIRMRGRFMTSKAGNSRIPLTARVITLAFGLTPAAYVDFTSAEYFGKYWLPSEERIELQAFSAAAGGLRSVVRLVTRFRDLSIEEAPADTSAVSSLRRVTWATHDSLSSYAAWQDRLGAVSSSVTADDFADVAPSIVRPTGSPTFSLFPRRYDRALHFNRIEGAYTGAQATVAFRDLAPGLRLQADGGWAWAERTARGGLTVGRNWSRSSLAVVGERRLAGTQDFPVDFQGDGASSLGSLLWSFEQADYVDRYRAATSYVRSFKWADARLTTTLAAAHDRDVANHLDRGLFGTASFLANRHARSGSYGSGTLKYEINPNVAGDFVAPGVAASLSVEYAAGDVHWARVEGSASSRKYVGPLMLSTRLDGGIVQSSDPPPQSLFELGGSLSRLPGYPYKYFAGDRAGIFRSSIGYSLPWLTAPIRIRRRLLPNVAPGLMVAGVGGWTGISSDATQRSIWEMGDGTSQNAVSQPTGHVRSTAFVGVTFFSRFLFVGFSRRLDAPEQWKFSLTGGAM